MTFRFKFQYHEESYEVIGNYGLSGSNQFIVTKFIAGTVRTMRALNSGPSGVKIEKVIQAESESDLLRQLTVTYDGLTEFNSC